MTGSVDPELRKRVERIRSSAVQLYREAGDYSNRELVEGIVVSPEDIAAIEAVARADCVTTEAVLVEKSFAFGLHDAADIAREMGGSEIADALRAAAIKRYSLLPPLVADTPEPDPAEAAHHRMVQPDHYQRWER